MTKKSVFNLFLKTGLFNTGLVPQVQQGFRDMEKPRPSKDCNGQFDEFNLIRGRDCFPRLEMLFRKIRKNKEKNEQNFPAFLFLWFSLLTGKPFAKACVLKNNEFRA